MSLINDALKKAQKQRTGDSPPLSSLPSVGGESAAKIAKRDKPAGFNAQLMRLALGAGGVLVVVIAGGYFVLRGPRRPAETATLQQPTTAPASLPAVAQQTAGQTPGGQKPATVPITFSLPIAPPAAPVSSITASAGSEIIPATTTDSAPAVKQTAPLPGTPNTAPLPAVAQQTAGQTPGGQKPTTVPPGSTPVKLDAKSITFIENLRIAGIRASATDSKVLMNDRVYRSGDIVEHNLGLKLISITASSLTFEDENGGRYTRNF